nr:MAG TPA: hypothetical protein [Caudoviricetes sp.]
MNTLRTLLAAVCGFAMLWFYTKDMIVAMNWTFVALMAVLLVPEKQKKSAEEESSSTQEK